MSFAHNRIGKGADALDGDADGVAVLDGGHALGSSGQDQVAGQQRHHPRDPFDDGADVMDHQRGPGTLLDLAVDLRAQLEVGRVDIGDDPRPDRAEGVVAFRAHPLTVLFLLVARRDVVGDRVAGDHITRAVLRNVATPASDHDRELPLVVELVRHSRQVNRRVRSVRRSRLLVEEHGKVRRIQPCFLNMILVIQADADYFSLENNEDAITYFDNKNIDYQSILTQIEEKFLSANSADADNAQDLFRRMNILLDEAEMGANWLLQFSSEIEQRYLRRLSIITELKEVLQSEQDELSLVYQPKICLKTRQVNGLEALIRWNSQRLGFIPPDEFIEIAEQAGFIEQVTDWVLNRVVADILILRAHQIHIKPAVNLSTQDIQNRPLLERLIALLDANELSADNITLEITESDLVADAKIAIANLQFLQDKGFSIAIDDFGTGYSSLAYLKNLPVSAIKIDKAFVLNLSTDTEDQQIVHTVLSLSNIFDLEVVAEGVEDAKAMEILAEWGCDTAQGYYISRPLPLGGLIDWLASSDYYQH